MDNIINVLIVEVLVWFLVTIFYFVYLQKVGFEKSLFGGNLFASCAIDAIALIFILIGLFMRNRITEEIWFEIFIFTVGLHLISYSFKFYAFGYINSMKFKEKEEE